MAAKGKKARSRRPKPSLASAEAKSEPAPKKGQGVLPGTGGTTTVPADIFMGFAKSTSRVVQQAASILEEEIAAGILAAKQVEERLINVRELRAGKPDEVMQRFRRDAHEVVDILLDVVNATAKSVGDLAQRAVSIRGLDASGKAGRMDSRSIPTLALAQPVRAGQSAELTMSVGNDSDTLTVDFSFRSSDLVSVSGDRISAKDVHFTPGKLTLPPRGGEKVKVSLHVPRETPPGTYAGLIQATNLTQLRAVLSVQVC
jgi:hypothetical protein